MELSIVVGNPRPKSRTLAVAEAVAERVAGATGASIARTVDLAEHADQLFEWPHDGMAALNDAIAGSEYVVFASPTYKAAYTGLLKAHLDRYPDRGLAGVTAIPVMTGGAPGHAMAVDTALRPVLVELGASLPTQGLFFVMTQMTELDAVVDEWAERNLTMPTTIAPVTRKMETR
ncbi:NADPH-dependent FMN reductase [Streptomyces sp. NPDC001393]